MELWGDWEHQDFLWFLLKKSLNKPFSCQIPYISPKIKQQTNLFSTKWPHIKCPGCLQPRSLPLFHAWDPSVKWNTEVRRDQSHWQTVTQSHCNTLTLPYSHTVTLSHWQTFTQSHCHTLTLPYCHTVTLSRCHTVTLSHCHTVTLSHSHTVILSHCHTGSQLTPYHIRLPGPGPWLCATPWQFLSQLDCD